MKKIIVLLLILSLSITLCGCLGNSGNLTEGATNATNTFNFALTYEAGEYHLHNVRKWKDSASSDAFGITTLCCDNQFWTSYNVAVLYTDKPTYLPDSVIICSASTN